MALHSPKEIIDLNINGAVNKANLKLSRMIAMGILGWNVYCGRWSY